MMRWLTAALCLVMTTVAPVRAAEWKLHADRDGIAVYNAVVPGQELRAFRGVVTVDSPLKPVLALLADTANMPAWFFQMRSARDVRLDGGDYIHFVIAGIWPVSDRDAVVRVSPEQQDDGTVVITVRGQPDRLPKQAGHVRIPRLESSWIVRPVSATRTEITLTTSSDPGGALPRWVANLVATDMPRHTLTALRQELRKPAYAEVDTRGSAVVKERLQRYRL